MELDLVVSAQQCAFQQAVRQVVGEEQLIANYMVLAHIRVLDRETGKYRDTQTDRRGLKDNSGLLIFTAHISDLFRFGSVPQLEKEVTNQSFLGGIKNEIIFTWQSQNNVSKCG